MINSDVTELISCCTLPDFLSFNSATSKQTIKSYSSFRKLPVIWWIHTLRKNSSLRHKSYYIYYVYVIKNFKSVLYHLRRITKQITSYFGSKTRARGFPNRLFIIKGKQITEWRRMANISVEKLKASTKITWQNSRLSFGSSENQ